MWANCVAWLVYSFLTTDPYVLASNIPGVLIATWMVSKMCRIVSSGPGGGPGPPAADVLTAM